MLMNIPDDIVQRLHQLAEQEKTSVDELLKHLLDQHTPKSSHITLSDMAKNALTANLVSNRMVDTAEQSRTILNAEYTDYLKNRMDNDKNGDSNRQ